jgi:hypothetical protein
MRKLVLLALAAAALVSGCAVMEEDNRPLTKKLDETIRPESAGAKIAWSPVIVPVAASTLIVDACVVHPIQVIPDAAHDTYDVVWKDPSGTYVTQTFLFLPKAAVTPVVFTLDWLGRSLFEDF